MCNFPDVVWNANGFLIIIYTCMFSCGDLHLVFSGAHTLAALVVQNGMSLLNS